MNTDPFQARIFEHWSIVLMVEKIDTKLEKMDI